ncbi:hypothetical protein BY996DRAFT_6416054 [Phakopsora pachyrhizi]|nr:hypothetical protein BY996DRAFT_6416054 [Phakopsora pachyrhizi]
MAANLQDKMSNSSKSEDEHTKDTVMDKEKEDSATLDERLSHTSSAKNEQVKASCAQKIVSARGRNIERMMYPYVNLKACLTTFYLPWLLWLSLNFWATRKKIQKNKIYASGQKTRQSNSIERSREKNSPQHLRSKPSYKKVDPDEDEGEDKIVQMMDELEFDD